MQLTVFRGQSSLKITKYGQNSIEIAKYDQSSIEMDMIKARYPVSCACYWLIHIVNFFSSFFIFVNNTLQIMKKFIWVYDHWSVIIKIKSNTYIFFGFYQVNWFSMNTLLFVCHRVVKWKKKIALLLFLLSGHLFLHLIQMKNILL